MNRVNEYPTTEYVELESMLNFDGFSYRQYVESEKTILQPQLEALGYSEIEWLPGETDSFGPLTRVCKAKDEEGEIVWFLYG